MQAVEAMTILIAEADAVLADYILGMSDNPENVEPYEQLKVAVAISQAMLNSAIPVARFRAHVTLDDGPEFTTCATDMVGIQAGLNSIYHTSLSAHITVWEQRATGAEMVSGYQGYTKSKNFRIWWKGLNELEAPSTSVN